MFWSRTVVMEGERVESEDSFHAFKTFTVGFSLFIQIFFLNYIAFHRANIRMLFQVFSRIA